MQVVIASCSVMPPEFGDDPLLVSELLSRGIGAEIRPWDDGSLDWSEPEAVIVRSTWDYTRRRDDFLAWTETIGDRLHNSPAVVAWNSDKRYLADLESAGIPVVSTEFVAPGERWPGSDGEVVVKPNISAGARDTGRFAPPSHKQAADLIATIHAHGHTAMVQPFQRSVDSTGETALVFLDGRFSHPLRKGSVLRPDEVAPIRKGGIEAAEAMYDEDLVAAGRAEADELELAERVIAEVSQRFAYRPLYGRVDMLRDERGDPILLELELVEPNLYFSQAPTVAARLAEAIAARLLPGPKP